MIEILTGSALNTIQDQGRPHAMTLGVARGGAMDGPALACGNMLLGNPTGDPAGDRTSDRTSDSGEPAGAAGIEIAFFPFRVRFLAALAFAVTGARGPVRLDGLALPPDWACWAAPGQVLEIGPPAEGCRTYLALAGGIDVPLVLGARATDLKGGFGGLEGRALQRGDVLRCGPAAEPGPPRCGWGLAERCPLPDAGETRVRVLPAAEFGDFTAAARHAFLAETWRVTPSANRMGYRLEGEPLALQRATSLFSHGIVPGTVQVPPAGQPIVQMADANTCGGYPKIATVIAPDLRLLAQTPVNGRIRFVETSRAEAVAALRDAAARQARRQAEFAALRHLPIPA